MAYDFKKEQKEFYAPSKKPAIIVIPKMNFVAVRGTGDPNDEDGAYKKAIPLLYGIAWTIKMSCKDSYKIDGFFEHTVLPLEGLWWQDGITGIMRGYVCNVYTPVLTTMNLLQSHSWIDMQ